MNYDDYRREMSEKGTKYENYIYPIFAKEWGVPESWVKPYQEKDEQIDIGENSLGVEIKYDEKSIKSKNIYIETAEKSVPYKPDYTPSGIYRDDNSWLFAIGNYDIYYVFLINHLRELESLDGWGRVETPTSRAFLMPHKEAEKLALNFTRLKYIPEQLSLHWSIQPQSWMDKL